MAVDRQYKVLSSTINPANVVANTAVEQTFTVAGIKAGDAIVVNKPSVDAGVGIVGYRVSADDTIGITFMNVTAGDVNPASETYLIGVMRP